jgi:hypothetical protein
MVYRKRQHICYEEAVDGLFAFQKEVDAMDPTVVEVHYPDKPISVLFPAGSLVHHRYRTEHGNARSCIIAAFHLVDDSPGAMIQSDVPRTLDELLLGYQDNDTSERFMSLLLAECSKIEDAILAISDPSAYMTLVDTSKLIMGKSALRKSRENVVNAPSSSSVKLSRRLFRFTTNDCVCLEPLIERLASAMSFDKHGLLDLILYEDGHEEIRKPARRQIISMPTETISRRLAPWSEILEEPSFASSRVLPPAELQSAAHEILGLIARQSDIPVCATEHREACSVRDDPLFRSFLQLLVDLSESVVRCELVETYITTVLMMFWTLDHLLPFLQSEVKEKTKAAAELFLRTYMASVVLSEKSM